MRTLAAVNADLAAMRTRHAFEIRVLRAEKRRLRTARNDLMRAAFEDGRTFVEIARDMGLPEATVRGILWAGGRTKKGRDGARRVIRGANGCVIAST